MAHKKKDVMDDVRIEVPHVKQQHNWDCGLACVQMVLRYFSVPHEDLKEVCQRMNFGDSVWTIDLAYILRHYAINHLLCTITVGVDKGYSSKSFYKNSFSADELRVNKLFQECKEGGVNLEKRSVDIDEVLDHLERRQLIIALIDWSYLNCKWCARQRCFPDVSCLGRCANVYQGHFIVVCGFNRKEKLIYYKNPSFGIELCCCSVRNFDQARKSYGTDEDFLFIYDRKYPSIKEDSA